MIYQRALKLRRLTQVLTMSAMLAGCAANAPLTAGAEAGVRAAKIAADQVGVRYRYGGADRSGFDCSGLVYYAYRNAGVRLPRTTTGLWTSLQPVSRDKLRTGDILFFDIKGKIAHVGMYLGDSDFVHAPASGRHVSIESLHSAYYRRAFVRAGRQE